MVDPQFYIEHRSGTGNRSIIKNYASAFNVYFMSLKFLLSKDLKEFVLGHHQPHPIKRKFVNTN